MSSGLAAVHAAIYGWERPGAITPAKPASRSWLGMPVGAGLVASMDALLKSKGLVPAGQLVDGQDVTITPANPPVGAADAGAGLVASMDALLKSRGLVPAGGAALAVATVAPLASHSR